LGRPDEARQGQQRRSARWLFIVALAPLRLPLWAIRKTLDRIA